MRSSSSAVYAAFVVGTRGSRDHVEERAEQMLWVGWIASAVFGLALVVALVLGAGTRPSPPCRATPSCSAGSTP